MIKCSYWNTAQATEDEETDPSTENEEAPEGNADPEEIVEEGTALPATPALGTRSLLTAQVAKAASGPACPNCGVNTFLSNSTDRYHNYTCQNENCTYRYQHVISEAHSGGTATCTEKAKCEVCGYEYGDPLGHDLHYSPAKEPTCTEIGWYEDYICYRQGCGMVFTDAEGKNPTTAEAVTRAALGHDWESDWSVDVDKGVHYHACSRCDARLDEAEHSGGEGTATCVTGKKCDQCGERYGEVDLTRHASLTTAQSSKAPTCTDAGSNTVYRCNGCNHYVKADYKTITTLEDEVIPALGHDWGDWTADPDDGTSHYRVCKREGCGATETEKHHADSYKYWSSSIHYVKCMVCLEKTLWASEPHTLGNWQDNGDGTHTGKCVCGMTQTVEHTYTWTYVDDDTHKGVCECGAQTTEAHSGGTATCTSGPICERCGKEYDKPLGHDWTGKIVWQWTEKAHYVSAFVHYTCQREGCGAYDNQDMHFEKVTNAACDAEGEIVYSVSLAANETLTGVAYTDEKRETISPLGHDLIHHDAQMATCTEVGWDAYDTCSRCDYTTYKEIPALGHDLVHHDAQAATCTEVGWEAYDTCSRCDYSTYKEIAALGHDLKAKSKVEPTCAEPGTEAYWMCQRDGCSKLFSDAEGKTEIEAPVAIPALGHTPGTAVRENEKPASCKRAGSYDEVVYCSVCGKELSRESKSIPTWGHNYTETGHTITRIYYRCGNCGDSYWIDSSHSRSLIPDLVRDENGENVNYIAGVSRENGKRMLAVAPDLQGEEELTKVTSLWLKPEHVERWLKEGVSIVRFHRDDAILEIELAEITLDWFTFDEEVEKVDFYVFTLNPSDDEILVDVSAIIEEEKTSADELTGIALKVDETVVDVKQNGTYRIEKRP